jgi:hypothetical protein
MAEQVTIPATYTPQQPIVRTLEPGEHIPMEKWGKDHWSTLAYVECRCVDNKGVPNREHLRCDADIHPGLTNSANRSRPGVKYPTRLNNNSKVLAHDDWSCIKDMEREGLVEWNGTGINPVFKLTKKGHVVCAELRKHKADGGYFANFEPQPEDVT